MHCVPHTRKSHVICIQHCLFLGATRCVWPWSPRHTQGLDSYSACSGDACCTVSHVEMVLCSVMLGVMQLVKPPTQLQKPTWQVSHICIPHLWYLAGDCIAL
jgi:hypothetical protein